MAVPKVYQPGKAMEMAVGADAVIKRDMAKSSGKAKQRFVHTPLGVSQANGQEGKVKNRANTPGGPTGS